MKSSLRKVPANNVIPFMDDSEKVKTLVRGTKDTAKGEGKSLLVAFAIVNNTVKREKKAHGKVQYIEIAL